MIPVTPQIEGDPPDVNHRDDAGGPVPREGSFEFKRAVSPQATPPVYHTLADHQRCEGWEYRDLLEELHRWAAIFEREFRLGVPEVALAVERLRCTRLGHFRYGHNGFGLRGEIAINRLHLQDEFWEVLGTLLHELLHGWQQANGKPGRRNYHNQEFRAKARLYGLIVDERGCTQYEPGSPFLRVLERHGVRVPELPQVTPTERPRGSSKLKKWSCGCTNVRVAVRDFAARCLHCNRLFEPAGVARPS